MFPDPQETLDLFTFTEEILNGKLDFLCSDCPEAYLGPYQRSMMLFFENWSLKFKIFGFLEIYYLLFP